MQVTSNIGKSNRQPDTDLLIARGVLWDSAWRELVDLASGDLRGATDSETVGFTSKSRSLTGSRSEGRAVVSESVMLTAEANVLS
jgi:hypothetical protein